MTRKYTVWTKENLKTIVETSSSYAECIRKMGLIPAGGNYKNLQKNIMVFNLDTSHMKHQGWNKGNEHKEIYNLTKPSSVKKRLLKHFGNVCQHCKEEFWMGVPIPLELEHIDGNKFNNKIDNVTLLCCNCHALTPTWRNRKRM